MGAVGTLVARDVKVFLRSRASLVFTCSSVVLCLLFLAFFRPQVVVQVSRILPGGSDAAADAWVFGSVAALSGFSSSASVLVGFVEARLSGRFGLQLTSAKRWQVVLGYVVSSVLVSLVVSVVIVLLGQVWALAAGRPLMTILQWLQILLGLLLSAAFFTGLNAVALRFIVSHVAFGAYCLIMGTMAGILSFSLVPLQGNIAQFVGALPFFQTAALVRGPLLASAVQSLGADPATIDSLSYALGTVVRLGGSWPPGLTAFFLLLWTVLALVCAFLLLTRSLQD